MIARIALLATLAAPLAAQQFDSNELRSLFDGETTTGWVTKGGRYDGNAAWSIEDGLLTGREGPKQAGGLIYTDRYYENFVFVCDVKIDEPFDSGIFLRMVPRNEGGKGAQVTLDARPGGEIGAVYADGFLQHNKKNSESALRHGEWNRFEVAMIGNPFHLRVWMNGALLTDYRLPADKSDGFAPRGRIGLQVHGARNDPESAKVQFRNMAIRELPSFDSKHFVCDVDGVLRLRDAGHEHGWQLSEFGGEVASRWRIGPGRLDGSATNATAQAWTADAYGDFDFRADLQVDPGVDLRFLLGETMQVRARENRIGIRRDGSWNTVTISRRGGTVKFRVNGVELSPFRSDEAGQAARFGVSMAGTSGAVRVRNAFVRPVGS